MSRRAPACLAPGRAGGRGLARADVSVGGGGGRSSAGHVAERGRAMSACVRGTHEEPSVDTKDEDEPGNDWARKGEGGWGDGGWGVSLRGLPGERRAGVDVVDELPFAEEPREVSAEIIEI